MEGVEETSAIRTFMKERVRNVRKVHLRLLACRRMSPYVYGSSYMLQEGLSRRHEFWSHSYSSSAGFGKTWSAVDLMI